MNSLNEIELEQIHGGWTADGALTVFGAQLAADGLTHAGSGNPLVAGTGVIAAAAGGWIWAFGTAFDGIAGLLN